MTQEQEGWTAERVRALTDRFDEFLGACLDEAGKPRAPLAQDMDAARAALAKAEGISATPAAGQDPMDALVLRLAGQKIAERFGDCVAGCSAEGAEPTALAQKDLMRARACLPARCPRALTGAVEGKKSKKSAKKARLRA